MKKCTHPGCESNVARVGRELYHAFTRGDVSLDDAERRDLDHKATTRGGAR